MISETMRSIFIPAKRQDGYVYLGLHTFTVDPNNCARDCYIATSGVVDCSVFSLFSSLSGGAGSCIAVLTPDSKFTGSRGIGVAEFMYLCECSSLSRTLWGGQQQHAKAFTSIHGSGFMRQP